jgi:uncharacterized membrane protein YfcA
MSLPEFALLEWLLIGLIFVWSGFVRSGLGFGGAVLSLPLLLMISNQPLLFLPVIASHLLIFSSATVLRNHLYPPTHRMINSSQRGSVDWFTARRALTIMLIPKLLGVAGVIALPPAIISAFVFAIVAVYAMGYLSGRQWRSSSKRSDIALLALGGYASGASLIGAPLVMAVLGHQVAREQLRDTLFVIWFVLVAIKMVAFVVAGVPLQGVMTLALLPCAGLGHLAGLRFHQMALRKDASVFFRAVGALLLPVALVGLAQLIWRTLSD